MNRSVFPEQIDTFAEVYDLPPSKVAQARRYQELKMQATLNSLEQTELNNLVTELKDYLITPETFNKFADALVNVETFFTEEVQGFIDTKQKALTTLINNFKYAGAHSTSKAYVMHNVVTSSSGDLYIALKSVPTSTALSNTSYWQKASSKGDKGDVGLNAYYKGAYSSTKTYAQGDAVDFNGNIYYANETTTAGESPSNSAKWKLWDNQIVSKTAPSSPQSGVVWVELLD